ncbi:hypothetical protein [Actinokineospora sp.]|uniref:hypothetical protein n=1 Tax=Actinokineospora sp. TaxID=1872133 RepID=UPI004037ABC4
MRWAYCNRWNGLLEAPIDVIDASEASRRHDLGALYTVVGTGADRTELVIEVRFEKGYVGVKFLDDRGRVGLIYSFKEIEERLFLRKMISYDYGDSQTRGDRADPVIVESLTYAPEGICRQEIDDSRVATIRSVDRDSVDVSTHWEPIPVFGEYDSVARWDRG